MSRTEFPIVLAHGFCRFDYLMNTTFVMDNSDNDNVHYFRRIRSTLRQHGYETYHGNVSWGASVDQRAKDLREFIVRLTEDFRKYPKVHIIGHSMGGLDARHMIVDFDMADRVATLTTIGTPHHGTSAADWAVRHIDFVLNFVRRLGLDVTGMRDTTRASCLAFNQRAEKIEERSGIRYQTYAGARPYNEIFAPLKMPYRIVEPEEGANDGLVSVESARWKDDCFVECLHAHHLNEMGWAPLSDRLFERDRAAKEEEMREVYLKIAAGLE